MIDTANNKMKATNKMKASHPVSDHREKSTYSKKDHQELVHLARNLRRVKRQLFLQHIEDSKPVQFDSLRDVLLQKPLTDKESEESVATPNNGRTAHRAVQPKD
jgi:hypothetical protein